VLIYGRGGKTRTAKWKRRAPNARGSLADRSRSVNPASRRDRHPLLCRWLPLRDNNVITCTISPTAYRGGMVRGVKKGGFIGRSRYRAASFAVSFTRDDRGSHLARRTGNLRGIMRPLERIMHLGIPHGKGVITRCFSLSYRVSPELVRPGGGDLRGRS